jgi:environmental stress-induced protein Ves
MLVAIRETTTRRCAMTMLIPFAGLEPVCWKNGGGSTTQIAVFPQEAGFEANSTGA